ncbi:TRAP-type mannitol/chloroaromatic compound transport system, small permease component [Marinomonas polaris DSM 16579]|uniref:TRAP transporter small permease protein n=1 Tax=Marinomonas polaris DSM 16579 TaxID=1122206 RepID=A0A1M4VAL6_9GAMM|nr:TRAP transporter small permease [Marinomonas polaris]SHE65943.1 TRAP-type mannitol/chloroaromatic compound transport system, small permease component [Marinomonas polaris DSM 16579]
MNIIRGISDWLGKVVSWFFLISVAITGYEVGMRYLLNSPTTWVFDLSLALSAAAIILSGSYVMKERDHIAITAIQEMLPEKWQHRLVQLNSLFCFVVCLCIAWAGWRFGMDAIMRGESTGGSWDVPIPAIIKPMITVSAVFMSLQALVNFIEDTFSHEIGSKY